MEGKPLAEIVDIPQRQEMVSVNFVLWIVVLFALQAIVITGMFLMKDALATAWTALKAKWSAEDQKNADAIAALTADKAALQAKIDAEDFSDADRAAAAEIIALSQS